jgi:hypothetical protein
MSEINLEERIENLKKQQEQAKELFIKYQGAIELLVSMKEEKNKEKDSSKKKDKK